MKNKLFLFLVLIGCFFCIHPTDVKALDNGTYVMQSALDNKKAVDVFGLNTANGTNVQLYDYTGALNQQWKFTKVGDYYLIESKLASGVSMDVYRGLKESGTNVQIYMSKNSINQRWLLKEAGNGYYYVVSVCNGLYLDVFNGLTDNRTNIQLSHFTGADNQKFKIININDIPKKTINDGIYNIKAGVNNSSVLEASKFNAQNDTNIWLFKNNGNNNQKWNVEYLGDGYYSIKSVLNSNLAMTTKDNNIQLNNYNGSDNQKWVIKEANNGYFYIVSKNNNYYFDIYMASGLDKTNVQTHSYNGGNNQKFKFEKTDYDMPKKTIENGRYTIKTALNNNSVLDVENFKTSNDTNIRLFKNSGNNNQKWDIEYLGDGYYSMKSVLNNNAAISAEDYNLQVNEYIGADNQEWIIKAAGNGYYYIISKEDNNYLDIYRGSINDGTNVQTHSYNGGNNQKFKFEKTTYDTPKKTIDEGVYTIGTALNNNSVLETSGLNLIDGTNVHLRQKNDNNNQKWNVEYLGDGYYSISNVLSNELTFTAVGDDYSTDNIELGKKGGTNKQKWVIKNAGNGYYYIISKSDNSFADIYACSTKDGTNVQTHSYNGGNNQKFKFEKTIYDTPKKTLENGTYIIKTALNNSSSLDLYRGNTINGSNIQLYNNNGDNNQKWNVKVLDNGYYVITSVLNDDMAVSVGKGISPSAPNVQLDEYKSANEQQWVIKEAGNGYYYIVSKVNNYYVDIYMNFIKNGTNVQTHSYNGGNNQKFKFILTSKNEDVPIVEDGVYNISSLLNDNMSLDVAKSAKMNGTNIILYDRKVSNNQLWYLNYTGSGYYYITTALNKEVALTAESITDGANVSLYKYNGIDTQLWKIYDRGNGTYSIVSKASENYLSLAGNQASKGSNVLISGVQTNDSQKFKLNKYIGKKVYTGIDVSAHQGDIEWEKIANNELGFVIIRAGYGGDWTQQDDKKFKQNVAACEKYNIPYGIYLYSYADSIQGTNISASAEATHVLRLMKEIGVNNYRPTLGTKVYLDIEDPEKQANLSKPLLSGIADKFCSTIESYGYECGIYASRTWLENKLDTVNLAKKYNIWLAEWPNGVNTFEAAMNKKPVYNLTNYKLWQFSSNGSIDGILNRVDLDLGYDIFE